LPLSNWVPSKVVVSGDAIDGVQDGVDLKLVGTDLICGQCAAVGRLSDQTLQLREKVADLAQAPSAVPTTLLAWPALAMALQASVFLIEVFHRDQPRGVVSAAVDLQTGAQTLQTGVQRRVVLSEHVLRDQARNICMMTLMTDLSVICYAAVQTAADIPCFMPWPAG